MPQQQSMCRWGHRAPLKATAKINFSQGRLALGAGNDAARDVLKELTRARGELLASMCSLSTPVDTIDGSFLSYLGLLKGLGSYRPTSAAPAAQVPPPQATETSGASADAASSDPPPAAASASSSSSSSSRMKSAVVFKWTDNVTGKTSVVPDVDFEEAMMYINIALWHMKHASKLALGDIDSEDLQKGIYKSLQTAAGIFALLEQKKSQLPYYPNSDLDERMITVQRMQALAEAQEVTVERARQKQHKPALLAGLARDTYEKFEEAEATVSSVDASFVASYKTYLQFKKVFYQAYALCYTGVCLFEQEKCGDSVKALQQAKELLNKSGVLAKEYSSWPIKNNLRYHTSCGFDARVHRIFQTLSQDIATALDKSERENGFIYFHKIPAADIEPLPGQGLVKATPYGEPSLSPLWSEAEFNLNKIPLKGEMHSADKAADDDAPISETPDEEIKKPTVHNEAFCVVS